MFQNLKVDVIYYKTNTDFEMEFNLCGCCRMRLLTNKAPDRKVALHSLSQAVSRSRIIIVTGALFGEDNIMDLISGAIASDLQTIDNKTYGISENTQIQILKGATPLVTKEGYFGGCIIESGPQTMILLSENKNIRKPIMQTLIHPYVEELCAIELKEKAAAMTETSGTFSEENDIQSIESQAEEISEPLTVENEVADTLAEEELTETEISASENDEAKSQLDDFAEDLPEEKNTSIETPSENDSFYIEFETTKKAFSREAFENKFDDSYLTDDSNFSSPHPSGGLNIFIAIITIFMLIALAVLCYCIFYIPSKSGMDTSTYIKETFNILLGKA